jgi:hypothetical protein
MLRQEVADALAERFVTFGSVAIRAARLPWASG